MSLLDIDPEDILDLSAQNVEKLVCRLCQEAFRKSGLSATHVISGGHINNPDDGKDIYVPPVSVHRSIFLPPCFSENGTIFQVKHTDMNPAKIKQEIKKHPAVQNAVQAGQKYVLVCSANNWPPKKKEERFEVMRTEFSKQKEADLEILDGSDLVHWLSDHPCLILWVREKIGRPLTGWESYDDWSTEWEEKEYIGGDQQGVLHKLNPEIELVSGEENPCKNSMSTTEGISALRKQLSSEYCKPIRLVGISGSGKTRLVGALFDERVKDTSFSDEALSKNWVYYTRMSSEPDPHPTEMARQMIERDPGAILIVDNCPTEMHKDLVNVDPDKKIRILTIEYDVREDKPKNTDVFVLEVSENDLAEKVICLNYPEISKENVQKIADMSGGNLQLALLLADGYMCDGSIDSPIDRTLFKRIFWQRNDTNDRSLLKAAQILSLVHSFNGAEQSEDLGILSSLTDDLTPQQLYIHDKALRKRKVVQNRGDSHAVLPTILANWLAQEAFDLGRNRIVEKISKSNSLTKSFARRIGDLHDYLSTQEIAMEWLNLEEGLIGKKLHCLNCDEMEILENITPSCPDKVLDALENMLQDSSRKEEFLSPQNQSLWGYARLLQNICYGDYGNQYSTKAANIIVEIARSDTFDSNVEIISKFLEPVNRLETHTKIQTSRENTPENLLKKVMYLNYPEISQESVQKIADMSGGNSQLALLLADGYMCDGSLDGPIDQSLFERIFWQRDDSNDKSLLKAAQVLSLVHSFNGIEQSEDLEILSSLTDDLTPQQLYGHVEELRRRRIVQNRGDSSAVLPPILANWLAKKAFDLGRNRIVEKISESNNLTKSFARRIGNLHDYSSTQEIAMGWLNLEEGLIGKNLHCLNRDEMEIFERIAPSCPDKVLDALEEMLQDVSRKEKFLSPQNQSCWGYARLLQKIGYDAQYFTRVANIIIEIARSETFGNNTEIISKFLKPLCYLGSYAGNQASMESKENLIRNLAKHPDEKSQKLAMNLLHATLKTQNLYTPNISFGLHSRRLPLPTHSQCENWYSHFIGLCAEYSCDERQLLSAQARKTLASEFRSLWSVGEKSEKILVSLEAAAEKLHKYKPWNEGWRAVRATNYFDSQNLENLSLGRLERLEKCLYPVSLKEEIRLFVHSNDAYLLLSGTKYRNDNDHGENARKINNYVESLGYKLIQDSELLKELLPELTIAQFSENRRHKELLGMGLAKNSANRERISKTLLDELKQSISAGSETDFSVLFGFLTGCSQTDQNLCHEVLDAVAADDDLMVWLPMSQSAKIYSDQRDIDRLLEHLDSNLDESTLHKYTYLYGPVLKNPNIFLVVDKILEKYPNGSQIAEEIMASTLSFLESKPSNFHLASCVKILSKSFSAEHESSRGNDGGHRGYKLSVIFKTVLDFADEKETKQVCQKLCEDIFKKIKGNHYINGDDYRRILKRISKNYSYMFLNIFLLQDDNIDQIEDSISLGDVPYSGVPREDFIDWCREDPETRCKLMARVVDIFGSDYEPNDFFYEILSEFRDQELILIEEFCFRTKKIGWGSLSEECRKKHSAIVNLLNSKAVQSQQARKFAEQQRDTWKGKMNQWEKSEKQETKKKMGFE